MAEQETTRVKTGKVRFIWPHVFKPFSQRANQEAKYSTVILIPKKDKKTLARIEAAIEAAKEKGKNSKFNGKLPKNLKTPLGDGDEDRDSELFAGHYFMTLTGKRKPGLVDADLFEIEDEEEFYSGVYGRVTINFYAFNNQSVGVAAGLENIQKLEDGERIGGGASVSAADDFADDSDF